MPGLESVLAKLRDAGYKITNARRVVLQTLQDSGGHLTSSELIERVEARDPTIGRASIFRTLDLLTGLAVIRPTFLSPTTPTYVLMSQKGHHLHIVCTRCAHIIELDECYVHDLAEELEKQHHFRLTGHLVEFYGVCERCRETDRRAGEA